MSSASLNTPAAAAPSPLDAAALAALAELDPGGATGLVGRVLRTFDGSLARLMAQFAQARQTGDMGSLRHVAHTLKSSSASVGALALSAACADVERRIREQHTNGMDAALDSLMAESARVATAVGAMLRE